jgi:hypothetical protein
MTTHASSSGDSRSPSEGPRRPGWYPTTRPGVDQYWDGIEWSTGRDPGRKAKTAGWYPTTRPGVDLYWDGLEWSKVRDPERSPIAPGRIDGWYLVCLVLPLFATVTSLWWYPHTRGGDWGFIGTGWLLWTIAVLAAAALGSRFTVERGLGDGSSARFWNRLSTVLLTVTGLAGLILTLAWIALGAALGGGIGL